MGCKMQLFIISLLLSMASLGCYADDSLSVPLIQAKPYTAEGLFTHGIEGPAVDRNGLLYTVNYEHDGSIGVIDSTGNPHLFVDLPKGSIGNAIRFNRKGGMFVADYTGHNILYIEPLTKQITVYAHSALMHQPNDIAISANGTLYASDPDWSNNTGQLWLIRPKKAPVLVEAHMGTTNGIEVSPDEKYLYVNESVQRNIWRYEILPDGGIANKKLFYQFKDFGMDGMRTDQSGNLYVARYGAGEVAVLSPNGQLMEKVILTGKFPTNLAFGGPDGTTLYITLQKKGALDVAETNRVGRSRQLFE